MKNSITLIIRTFSIHTIILLCIGTRLFAQQGWEKIETVIPEPYLANTGDNFGSDVAIDFDYAVVGTSGENNGNGVAYVLQFDGSNWVKVAKLAASDAQVGDLFGSSVAIEYVSPHEQVIVVGATKNGKGAIYIFKTPTEGWSDINELAKIEPENEEEVRSFGVSAAISNETIVVGGLGEESSDFGTAYIYEEPNDGWSSMDYTAKISSSDIQVQDGFGEAVSIHNDVIVMGAAWHDITGQQDGAAYVYVKPESGWEDMNETAKLTASDASVGDLFGFSVSINHDAIAVGAPYDDNERSDSGAVYLFEEPVNGWSDMNESFKLIRPVDMGSDTYKSYFGHDVSIRGNQLGIGCTGCDDGAVFLYEIPESGVQQVVQQAILSLSTDSHGFGSSIDLFSNSVVVGHPSLGINGPSSGSIAFFERPALGWENMTETDLILPEKYEMNQLDLFGNSVAIKGDMAVIGSRLYDNGKGAAFVFRRNTNTWEQLAKLTKKNAENNEFGRMVDFDENKIIVSSSDSVYVFERSSDDWVDMNETAKLYTSGEGSISSIAIDNDVIVVGAESDRINEIEVGVSYLFSKPDGSNWVDALETAKLTPSDGFRFYSFGNTVSISGDVIAIGAPNAYQSSSPGYVYVFAKPENGWENMTQTAKLSSSDGETGDSFGRSVSIDDETIIVGASNKVGPSHYTRTSAGAAYIFEKEPNSNWMDATETAKIEPSQDHKGESFGITVSIDNSNVIVGNSVSDNSTARSQLYIYSKPEDGWVDSKEYISIDLEELGVGSTSSSISENTILIGNPSADTKGTNTGEAYFYSFVDKANIKEFVLDSEVEEATIDSINNTILIDVYFNTDLTNLRPDLVLSEGATSVPSSNDGVDFSNGTVKYTVTNATGTFSKEWEVTVNPTTILSIEGIDINDIILYPNPSGDGKFKVVGIESDEIFRSIAVYNILGKSLMKFNADIDNREIDLSNQPSGVYFIRIESNGSTHLLKAVKN